ncbi:MAG: putative bifunctional diguanylate cyclase/phosphodiesterase [Cellulomonas sp.]
MRTIAEPSRWRFNLWVLGTCMVGLGLAMGLAFPYFLLAMHISPDHAAATSTRVGCLAAGIIVGGLNYLLARLVLGGRLRQSEERYRSLIEESSDLVLVTDRAGVACFVSPSATRLLASPEPGNRECVDLLLAVDEPDRATLGAALRSARPGEESSVEVHITTPTRTHTFELSIQDLTRCAAIRGLVLTGHEITDQRALQNELEYRGLHDALTGLPNRVLLADRCTAAVRTGAHTRTSTGLLLIDLDRFKEINDTFGHRYGDELLTQIGQRLAGLVRDVDTVARLGGDEFAVLLPDVGGVADATACATALRAALETPFRIEGIEIAVDASIGVVHSGDHGQDATTLLRRADIAMYVAKTRNLGTFAYDAAADRHSPAKVALLAELRRALDRDELVLHFQPKVQISTGAVVGAEALVRWQHPSRGLVFPDEFIPLAEETPLIGPLTLTVLDLALAQARTWSDAGRPLPVSVNLSARNLHDERLTSEIGALLARHGVPPELLELEVTESAIMTEPERATELLGQLGDRGIRISIDDFGVGYTSLGQLKHLPVSELKIDRSFVMTMTKDRGNALIVQSVVDLGHAFNLTLVAEGVENEEILESLAELGCDVAQGYHLSRPVPVAMFDAWCADRPLAATPAPLCRPGTADVPARCGEVQVTEVPSQPAGSSSRR